MKQVRNWTLALLATITLAGCESTALVEELEGFLQTSGDGALSEQTIARGLSEALTVGSDRVVSTLGNSGGFADSAFRIPLPDTFLKAQETAARFGLSGPFDELEERMNLAAEAAVPQARSLLLGAVNNLTFADVMGIYRGPEDAATQYLKGATGEEIDRRMRPIVNEQLNQVGAVSTFKSLVKQYNALPLVKPIDADLEGHVTNYASAALFTQLAAEEAAIRKDPLKRSTELLRRVFGN